mmetsp:Transcript_37324/g.90663  ORF Transcript_37324/g.90663 Transcript_37324/m.90663 type:complete len:670 (-) Transcript_37324:63-2072(-)
MSRSMINLALVAATTLMMMVSTQTVVVLADDPGSEPAVSGGSSPTAAPACPMTCSNGGTCKLGEDDFSAFPVEPNGAILSFLQETSRDGWFCECPLSYTGFRCGRPYEVCEIGAKDDPQNPIHMCFHGGKCIDSTNIDGDKKFCDCTDAEHNGIPYYGRYCEIQGATECAEGSDVFCVANGQCKADFEEKAHPCDCPEGHRGPHCEFLRDQVPECTRDCKNDGECTLGIKDFKTTQYASFWETHDQNFQYCKCPRGWFGENCEVIGTKCGNAHCFNGGACLQTLNENDETTYACDCRTANADGKTWAGQYCEHAATTTCHEDKSQSTFNGKLFCTNGGECKDESEFHLGCNCPGGTHGPRCEFNTGSQAAKCTLDCQNGGSCRMGHPQDSSLLTQFGSDLAHLNVSSAELFQHCVCPVGYFGIQCEHEMEVCPGGQHLCLHGSRCVDSDDGFDFEGEKVSVNHKCDCDSAFTADEKYAGKFCQYSSTDLCIKNADTGSDRSSNNAFCVNNGICKARVDSGDEHPGCNCPDGFEGEHCEFIKGNQPTPGGGPSTGSFTSSTTDSSDDNKNLEVGIAVALCAVAIIGGFIIIRMLYRSVCGSRSSKGTTPNEVGSAVAAEEATAASFSDSPISNNGPKLFEDDSDEVEDYANNIQPAGSHEEKDMSDVQIV